MSESFTKLFGSILDSTIWSEDNETVRVWVTMLAMADQHGYVGASVPGLAHRAHVSLEATEQALAKFLAPDPYSRSRDHEGRRIEEADRGWTLLNYGRFREMRDEEVRKEYERKRKRQQRKTASKDVPDNSGQSRKVPQCPTVSAQAEAEAEAEAEVEQTRPTIGYSDAFEAAWSAYPKRPNNSKHAAWRAWRARVGAGETEAALGEGVTRYAAYVAAQGVEARFVKQASTFFGPDQHYLNDYTVDDDDHLTPNERASKAAIQSFAEEGA